MAFVALLFSGHCIKAVAKLAGEQMGSAIMLVVSLALIRRRMIDVLEDWSGKILSSCLEV